MKNLFYILFLLLFSAFIPASDVPTKPEDVSPLLIGEKIPVTMLTDASGKSLDFNETIKDKSTILIFYRGGWCPFCVKQLMEIQQVERELAKSGWQVVAVSPDSPENLKNTATKQNITFTLFSDADMAFAKSLGIAFKGNYGKMLEEKSGGKNKDQLLPVPAVFFIDSTGMIRFEYINPNFKDRMSAKLMQLVASNLL
jgi:peroxiredoxin